MSKTLNAFAGYPTTIESQTRNGQKRYTVSLRATGPLTANIRDKATFISTGISAIVAFGFAATSSELSNMSRLAISAVPVPLFFGFRGSFEWLLARRVTVVFTPERISVHNFILPKYFDRSLNIKFVLHQHERALRQAEIIKNRQANPDARRRILPDINYYEQSYRLYIEVLGQSYLIMTIRGKVKAQRFCARLNAIHQSIESSSGRGAGIALIASDDWVQGAGELL